MKRRDFLGVIAFSPVAGLKLYEMAPSLTYDDLNKLGWSYAQFGSYSVAFREPMTWATYAGGVSEQA